MISVFFFKNSVSRSLLASRNQSLLSLRRLKSTASQNSSEDTSNEVKSPEFYDIVICGGGMVGSAMAYALGKIFSTHTYNK